MSQVNSETQDAIQKKGEEIFKLMESNSSQSLFDKDYWYGRIMEWSMKNAHFKTQMFRFVDVLPYLNSSSEVARHLKEYFAESGENLPSIFNVGLGIGSLAPGLVAGPIRKNVTQMAKMFIAGESAEEALKVISKNRPDKLTFTADLLGEAALSENECREYEDRYLKLMNQLVTASATWKSEPQIDTDDKGAIPKVNVSIKLSSLYSQINFKAWDETKTILKNRLRPFFKLAQEQFVFLNLDMEQYALKDLTLEVFKELICEPELRGYPHFGIVNQAYLKDALKDLAGLITAARDRKTPFTVRLVKGAYWDYETLQAAQKGWEVPVFTNKAQSDVNYEACARLLLDNIKFIGSAFGSHNVRSLSTLMVYAQNKGIPNNAFEIQMLYGMAEPIKRTLIQMGYRLRDYMPIGELIPGMAYLVRRLLENTSNESFLRSKFSENISSAALLSDPLEKANVVIPAPGSNSGVANGAAAAAISGLSNGASFSETLSQKSKQPLKFHFENEPLVDYAIAKVRTDMAGALKKVRGQFGKHVPLFIGKKEIKTSRELKVLNPSRPTEILGTFSLAGTPEADLALKAARDAFPSWSQTSIETRAQLLDQIADIMTKQRLELAAWQVFEVGKPWAEADGDVAEAIDFCRYYAQDIRRVGLPRKVGHAPGELSLYLHQPRGVALVIAPWNFPLAILTGQVVAAIVTGNTVIMKTAEQSTFIASGLMDIIRQVGIPPGVVNFVPGLGEEVGAYLVAHKDIEIIAFTGSRSVGLNILKTAGQTLPGQRSVKRCIIEMGGKNAIIIDNDADLDEAVGGVVYSSFGFAGQKCSACSRVIVLEDIYERFLERFIEATRSISVSASDDPRGYFGPVVDGEAHARILQRIADGKAEATLAFQGEVPRDGYFVPPTIFTDVKPNSRLAQEEIFGPVVAVIKAKTFEDAITIANGTDYALTGGVYSRSPSAIAFAKTHFDVGNLYINRQITGAMVDRHPFGGHKMSGVGSKTGGPDYLLQFMETRCVTENTTRRGFAPEETTDGI